MNTENKEIPNNAANCPSDDVSSSGFLSFAQKRANRTVDGEKRRIAAVIKANKGKPRREKTKSKISGSLIKAHKQGRMKSCYTSERNKKISEAQLGKARESILTKKGPLNANSRKTRFRSPSGIFFDVVNIADFVRNNEILFSEIDVKWSRSGKSDSCRAYRGLMKLTGNKSRNMQWKGWTLAGEVIFARDNGRTDL